MTLAHQGHHWSLRPIRALTARPRLACSGLVGMIFFFYLPHHLRVVTRVLVAWDIALLLFLGLIVHAWAGAAPESMRRRAAREDEGKHLILLLSLLAVVASVGAILSELGHLSGMTGWQSAFEIGLTAATIMLSWIFVQIIFALHYAHDYYGLPASQATLTPLDFPDNLEPDYWDFLNFSVVIGTAFATAGVDIRSKSIRRLTTLHSLIAFAFNTLLVALTINLVAGLLQK